MLTATLVAPAPPLEFITVKIRARPDVARPLLRDAVKRVNASIRASEVALRSRNSRARPHGSHNGWPVVHFADGENRNLARTCLDEFYGADGPLSVLRVEVDDDHFSPDILHLAQDRIRGLVGNAT